MTQNYQLVSLQLGTMFDKPVHTISLPAVVDRGTQDWLALIDGAERAPHRLARIVRPVSLLGLRVDRPGEPLTVTLEFLNDELSSYMWHLHDIGENARMRRRDKDTEPDLPDISARHRMLAISAQGATVASVVLGLRPHDGAETREKVTFQIPGDIIGPDGLVMIGIDSAGVDGEWGEPGHMVGGSVGLALISVTLEPSGSAAVPASVATGRRSDQGGVVIGETGFFAVNPGSADAAYEVELKVRGLGGDRLHGRRARAKHPARAAKEYLQDRRVDLIGGIRAEVRDLNGTPVEGCEVRNDRVHVPAGVGPVLVRPEKRNAAGEPMLVDWTVRVV